jgi:hypothetical protein
LALATSIGKWSLTSLQQRLVKTGGRLIQNARYYGLLKDRGVTVPGGIRRGAEWSNFRS